MLKIVQQAEQLLKITRRLRPAIQATEDTITFDFRMARAPRRLKRKRDWLVRYLECRGFQPELLCLNFPSPGLIREAISRHRRISFAFDLHLMSCANLSGIAPNDVDAQTRSWYKGRTFALMYGRRISPGELRESFELEVPNETAASAYADRLRTMLDSAEQEKEAIGEFRKLGGFNSLLWFGVMRPAGTSDDAR